MSLSDEHDLRIHMKLIAEDATRRARERAAMRTTGEERWYLTRMGPRCGFNKKFLDESDRETDDLFADYGCEYYQPKLRKMVNIPLRELSLRQRRSGLVYRKPRLVPFLGAYLPVRIDWRRQDWREFFDRARLYGIMYTEEAERTLPVPIQDGVIGVLRGREVDGAIPEALPVRKLAYEIGQVVRIADGPFRSFTGVVEEIPNTAIGDIDENIRLRLA